MRMLKRSRLIKKWGDTGNNYKTPKIPKNDKEQSTDEILNTETEHSSHSETNSETAKKKTERSAEFIPIA